MGGKKHFVICILLVTYALFSCQALDSSGKALPVPEGYLSMVVVNKKERDSIYMTLINPYYLENALPRGFVKDASVDYTEAIQKALNHNKTIIFPDFPLLINQKGISVPSGAILYFNRKSLLKLAPSVSGSYEILRIHDVKNVKIYFANILGDKYTHLGTDGEWGMGISLRGTENILLYSPIVQQCWGDGIYFGISPATKSVLNKKNLIIKALSNDNRRNAISIISLQESYIYKTIVANSGGTAPMVGIDIEPDEPTDIIRNIKFNNIVSYNNRDHGFLFALGNLYRGSSDIGSIELNNYIVDGSKWGLSFNLGTDRFTRFRPTGSIFVKNISFKNISQQEYFSYDTNLKNTFKVEIKLKTSAEKEKYKKVFNNAKSINIQ